MRSISVAVCAAALTAAGLAGGVGTAPVARAYDPSINGTYTATVVGQWARSRQVYHQEAMVRSTWKITTSCANAYECTGEVVSDQGWSAPVRMFDGLNWYLRRDIPNWETCDDGTSYTATDYIMFYPADPVTAVNTLGSPVFRGDERTLGPSGACGTNLPLDIEQPLRLDKIG
jgi:hypothetical protein